jgi:DNA polymerase
MKGRRVFRWLDALEASWRDCDSCALSQHRLHVVQWRGNPQASLCVVGEAPGESEDAVGLPFVGRSGQLLDDLLREAGLDPVEDVFVINAVACRPPGNRAPEREEVKACAPRFQALLKYSEPRCLLLLGGTAARLAGIRSITASRGERTTVEAYCYDDEIREWPAVATFHPSYLLRSGSGGPLRQQVVGDIRLAWKIAHE